MRWSSKEPKEGDRRWRDVFLFWPLTINGETRWLEEAVVEYEWRGPYVMASGGVAWGRWAPIAWLD